MLILGFGGLSWGLMPISKVRADGSTIVTISAPSNIPVGGTFVARVNIGGVINLNSFQIEISYDSSVIQLSGTEGDITGVTPGLVGSAVIPIAMWSFYPVGNPGGAIRILGHIPASQTVSGSGYLAEIHFNVIGSVGMNTFITPTETQYFANGLFNSSGAKLTTAVPWGGARVNIYMPLQINTVSLPAASMENNYNVNLTAAGGISPFTWTAAGLPAGLNISSAGTISGRPTGSGDFGVNLSVTDSASPPANKQVTLNLHVYPELQISSTSLPDGVKGTAYSAVVSTSPGALPLSWNVSGLPAGLTISSSGVISGSPTVSGDYSIVITITDSFIPVHNVSKTLSMRIYTDLSITTDILPSALNGSYYNLFMIAGGGKTPYTWSAAGLPGGLSITSSGIISGTPVTAGDFNITAYVSDSFLPANTASRALTLHVNPLLQITTTALPEGAVGSLYSASLTASGGVSPYSWSASGLPAGLTCSEAGVISGTPATTANSNVSITVTDSLIPANIGSTVLKLYVSNGLSLAISQIPEGLIGRAYTANLTASGGQAPYSWTVVGLPPGLTVSTTGAISGTAETAGNFILNVGVADSLSPPNTTTGIITLKIYKVGDANGDGAISIGDVTYIERVLLGLSRQTPGCDANLNGSVSITDVTRIERIILGLT